MKLHIGIFGKRNVGKSSLINKITNQEVSIVSQTAGTTTDVVEKSMEFLPLGPVVFIDTAGIDDISELGGKRIEKTKRIFDIVDIAVLVCDYDGWNEFDFKLFEILNEKKIPIICIVNKSDECLISEDKLSEIKQYVENPIILSVLKDVGEDVILNLKSELLKKMPDEFVNPPKIIADLLDEGDLAILVVPVDSEAPKGRLILPQVQIIRDLLDNNSQALVVKEGELERALSNLNVAPRLVITDSQAFEQVDKLVPEEIPMTSFSIAFARLKGDLNEFVKGAKAVKNLRNGDKILVYESCSHHATNDDIARVKIPRWLEKKTGVNLHFDYHVAHGQVENLEGYSLVIQCGGCMTNRKEILARILRTKALNVPITNYGVVIAYCFGILDRAVRPFSTCE